jgi:hypothetical protein
MNVSIFILGLFSAPNQPTPIYLSCVLRGPDKDVSVRIIADEKNKAATLEIPATGYVERDIADFSDSALSFTNSPTSGSAIYRIDRSDLTIVQTISGVEAVAVRGVCQIQPTPQRAF